MREVISAVREESVPGSVASVQESAEDARVESKRILKKPSEDAAWTNWELLD